MQTLYNLALSHLRVEAHMNDREAEARVDMDHAEVRASLMTD